MESTTTSHIPAADQGASETESTRTKPNETWKLPNSTEPLENGKLEVGNAQECKYSSTSMNKTDGQAKAFYSHLQLPLGKDGNHMANRPFEKRQKGGENGFELGVPQDGVDGTDSGVEVIRALSSNGSNSDRFTPVQSCGSSLVSYSSEPEADRGSECGSESSEKSRVRKGSDCGAQRSTNGWKAKKTYGKMERSRVSSRKASRYDGEGTSESCSETSSTHEAVTPDQLNRSIDFKRCASNRLHEPRKCENGKSSVVRRSESTSRNAYHDKIPTRSHSGVRSASTSARVNSGSKSLSTSRNIKSAIGGKCDAKGSKSRAEDGKWSSSQRNQTSGARIRVSSVADPSRKTNSTPMSSSMTSSFNGGGGKLSEVKSNALDKYGTLPRRPKKKAPDSIGVSVMTASLSRSSSVTREPSLNRAATLRRQQSREKENLPNGKTLPPYPRPRRGTGKILIYHEVSVQTMITSEDISNTSSGISVNDKSPEPVSEKESKGVQTEGKERLKKIEDNYTKQCEELEKARKENEELKSEKQKMVVKICKLLGFPESNQEELRGNGLEELEQHFQAVGLTVIKQQEELSELRHYKLIAHRDLEKSLAAQKNLLQQQQEIEEEYSELQEFLQAEKTALSESLLDTEEELTNLRNEVAKKQSLLEQQQEECKHLVRICEQRRQENLSLEAKLAGLDQRSRDVLVQQGAAVSAAAVALSGLGARLDTLVEQLSVSCNITDKDLEEIIYHNEAYNQSEDVSPDDPPSQSEFSVCPKRRESFIHVILGAIKSAAQSPFASAKKHSGGRKLSDQNSEVFFDTETEPCLNFETVLEENSSSLSNCTDYGSSSSQTEGKKEDTSSVVAENGLGRSNSLRNLSEAILNRQMVEENEGHVSLDEIIPIEVNSLVDQIIDVDNSVTKLLKVIRIIQGENERCVEELHEERINLTNQLHQEKVNRQKLESNLLRLQQELTDARSQLNTRIAQLEEVKALCGENQRVAVVELQKRFAILDSALGALNSVQDVVNQCPPLAKLRKDLEDCDFRRTSSSDVNANENGILEEMKRNGAVLTTAI